MPEPAPRDLPTLREIAKKVGEASGAKKVILFGSIARGDAKENSDLDLLLVIDDKDDWWEAGMKAQKAMTPRCFALDMLPMYLSTYKNKSSLMARVISEEGIVLFG